MIILYYQTNLSTIPHFPQAVATNEDYMRRCIHLALQGQMGAAPNPMVGAVIVHNGQIISEGYHIRCGGPHAEVMAIRGIQDKSLLKDSTLYVSLEPCSHYGKTPPCADLILETGIPRVVVGCIDPFSKVQGRGIEKLKAGGCQVQVGVLEKECLELNKAFVTCQTHKRPFVLLKWAQTKDGFLDHKRDSAQKAPLKISSERTAAFTQLRRSQCQAIMVGYRTALLDNPALTCRLEGAPHLLRVAMDRDLTLPRHLKLFDGSAPTLIFHDQRHTAPEEVLPSVSFQGIPWDDGGIRAALEALHLRGVTRLMVEGGSRLLQRFMDGGLWDEIHVEHSDRLIKDGVKAPETGFSHLRKEDARIMGRDFSFFFNRP